MQTDTLLSVALTSPTGQTGSGKPEGGGSAGSFTEALAVLLAGGPANAGAAANPSGQNGKDGKPEGDAAAEQSLVAAVTDALVPPTSGQTGMAAEGAEPGQSLPGAATAELKSLNGQVHAQNIVADAAHTHANGLALTAQIGEAAESAPGSATAQDGRSLALGAVSPETGGTGNVGSQLPAPAGTGEAPADGPRIIDPVLARGAVDPSAAVDGEGAAQADRLGIPVEAPTIDKAATVAAESAIRISALNEAGNANANGRGLQTNNGPAEPAARAIRVGGAGTELAGDPRNAPPTAPVNAAAEMASAANAAVETPTQTTAHSAEAAFNGAGSAGSNGSTNSADAATLGSQNARTPTSTLVQGQVTLQIVKAFANGLDRITIQLHPESLGRVDVRLDIGQDGRMTASIAADRPETLELLQRDARALERALQEAGLKTDSGSLSFHLRGNGGDGSAFGQQLADGSAGDGDSGGAEDGSDPGEAADNASRTLTGSGLLDIHV